MANPISNQNAKVVMRRDTGNNPGGGVCAGLANYLNLDTVFVRLAFIVMAITTFGVGFTIYLILYFVMPQQQEGESVAFPPGSRQERNARILAAAVFVGVTAFGLYFYGDQFL